MNTIKATAVLLAVLAATPASADFGYANSACWRFVESEAQAPDEAKRQWVLGYLSAAARYGEFDLLNSEPKDHLALVIGFCEANPKHSLEAAVRRAILNEQ
ncbi:MAG: hypothetical protein H6980_00765 [Gammaproteobacteria bacterium]|nr:hypothetical protein [Gammaproteobacteria bacterium]